MRQKCKSMALNGFIPKIFLKMYARLSRFETIETHALVWLIHIILAIGGSGKMELLIKNNGDTRI